MDDLAEWEQVGGEGNGTEHGALRDAVVGWGGEREEEPCRVTKWVLFERYNWNHASAEPAMQREVGEAFEVDDVANGFKSSREVKEVEDSDFTRVRSDEEVIGDLHQRGPCVMMCSVC